MSRLRSAFRAAAICGVAIVSAAMASAGCGDKSAAGCGNDKDCKSDRICVKGKCVGPDDPPSKAKSAASTPGPSAKQPESAQSSLAPSAPVASAQPPAPTATTPQAPPTDPGPPTAAPAPTADVPPTASPAPTDPPLIDPGPAPSTPVIAQKATLTFAPGTNETTQTGQVWRSRRHWYEFTANAEQTLNASISSPNNKAIFRLYVVSPYGYEDKLNEAGNLAFVDAESDATPAKVDMERTTFYGKLPFGSKTGDNSVYAIEVDALEGGANYKLIVSIH